MTPAFKVPFYAKLALVSIGLFALLIVLHIGEFVIVPLVFALVAAIALNPLVNFLINRGMNKHLAIFISVTLFVLLLCTTIYLIFLQLRVFSEAYPEMMKKFDGLKNGFLHWISSNFNIPLSRVNAWVSQAQADSIRNFAFMDRFSEMIQGIIILALIPVYISLILVYKPLMLGFLERLFMEDQHRAVSVVLSRTKEIIQSYLVGLFLEVIIVAVLNSVGLLILGIDFAILLGIIGAVLNIIPYLGGLLATALPVVVALATKESLSYPILVLAVYGLIQLIDNNIIIPRIVASRVKLNALVSIPVVIIGGAIWGIPGMFLSIPLTAIAKVVCDHIEPLKPWGYLLGNIVPVKPGLNFKRSGATVTRR